MKLSELAERTGARVEGVSDDIEIVGAAGLDEAGEGQVTFLANPRYTPRVNSTRASAIYLSEDAQTDRQIAILRVKDPYLAYTRALTDLQSGGRDRAVHSSISSDRSDRETCQECCYRRVLGDRTQRVHRR